MKTTIEWTRSDDGTPGHVWNPVRGCALVSPGCKNCYAMRQAHRFNGPGQPYRGLTELGPNGPRWSGVITWHDDMLDVPLRRKKPTRYFVNSMSDLFHEDVPFDFIDKVFAIMALSLRHTFQVLTKRPARMRQYLTDPKTEGRVAAIVGECLDLMACELGAWPLPNVWLGVSVENQDAAERLLWLAKTPAAVRWVSAEPLLGPVDLRPYIYEFRCTACGWTGAARQGAHPGCKYLAAEPTGRKCIDWVVAGGESGPGARPMHPDWARGLRDQCQAAGVPFFFKQTGAFLPENPAAPWSDEVIVDHCVRIDMEGRDLTGLPGLWSESDVYMMRLPRGDKGNRLLDGREWNEYPTAAEPTAPRSA